MPDPDDILYFCDESSHINDGYMAVGGLAVARRAISEISRELKALNDANGVCSEVKWTNAKRRRVNVHKCYVDYLFDLIDKKRVHLHVRFAPFGEYEHSRSGARGRVDTVSKMYYQLLLHRPIRY